ncbi:MAG TPA: DUF222 domain-containing protein [Acidimicrobiia bacterium]|nr:DUF222 domain-containing protein [Acidimicrobiia bacterium]
MQRDEMISVATRYLDALVSHRGDDVPFAPSCRRTECGQNTGASGDVVVTPVCDNLFVRSAQALCNELSELVGSLDPDAVPLCDVTKLWKTFDAIERYAAAGKTLLARRVDDAGAWKASGYKTAAEAMAATSGTSITAAKQAIETSRQVAELPATADAMRAGSLSPQKAEAIAAAASVVPERERELLAGAGATLREVRDECLKAKVVADGDAMYKRIHEDRRVRDYTDAEGAWNLSARGTPDGGAEVRRTLDEIGDELFKEARRNGTREQREAYAFDALVEMARRARGEKPDDAKKPSAKYLGLIRADLEALRRGHAEGDELCEITGIGPIPVARAKELLTDAVLNLVITKGTDVLNVTNLHRKANAAQRAALLWESPQCRVEGCSRMRIEIDHRTGWAITQTTRLDDLDNLCDHHHDLKTTDGWALVEGTGRRAFVPPDDPRHPRNRPPP